MPEAVDDLLSPRVRAFLLAKVDSVEMLEVLLMLAAHPNLSFTAQRAASQLRTAPHSVKSGLRRLNERHLVERLDDGSFRFRGGPELDGVLAEVAHAYLEWRAAVVQLIHSRPSDLVRLFADAFRRIDGAKR
jgi:hypothetical protein